MPTVGEYIEAFEAGLHRKEIAQLLSVSEHAVKEARKLVIAKGFWTPPAGMAASDWSGRKKAMPSQDVLVAAFKSGKPMAAIKKELGMSDTATYAARKKLEDAGILSKQDRGGRVLPSSAVMANAFRAGRPIEDLVEDWGAGKSTIYKAKQRLEEAGMLKNTAVAQTVPNYSSRFARKLPPETVVVEGFASGRSLEDLAKEWNVSLHLVTQARRDLLRVGRSGKRIGLKRVKDSVLRQLFESGRSTREIAAILGVSTQAAYLSKRKLEKRTGPVEVKKTLSEPPRGEMKSAPVDMFAMAKGLIGKPASPQPTALPIETRIEKLLLEGYTIDRIGLELAVSVPQIYKIRDKLVSEGRIQLVVRGGDVRDHDVIEIASDLGWSGEDLGQLIRKLDMAGVVKDLRTAPESDHRSRSIYVRGAGREF